MSNENKPWNILVPDEYEDRNGEVKTRWKDVGVAFPNAKGGFNCQFTPATLSISGRFVILPRSDRDAPAEGNGD